MIKRLAIIAVTIVNVLSSLPVSSHAAISVLTPPERAAVTGELLTIVVSTNNSQLDELQIFVNNRQVKSVAVKPDRSLVCIDGILISPGSNKIKIISRKVKQKTGEQNLSILLRTPLTPEWTDLPEGFPEYLFHKSYVTKICVSCHKMEFKDDRDSSSSVEKSTCYLCHKKLLSSYMVVHGPAAVWSCLMCHTQPSEKSSAKSRAAHNKTCEECHDEPIARWKARKFVHGPMVDGGCVTCHDPHASLHGSLLRLSTYDLCISCHEDIPRTPHVISGFSGGKHPLKLSSNPLKPGTPFSCITCHNPHSGDSSFFLYNYKGKDEVTEYCKSCHLFR